jgi:hypothetical protein
MITALSHQPPWVCGFIIVGIVVGLSLTGLPLFHWLFGRRLRLSDETNTHIIFFATAIDIFYSLTVGLIAVGVWNAYNGVADIVSAEATAMGNLYRDIRGYPDPIRGELQSQLHDYTELLITKSWPAQRRGVINDDATRRLTELEKTLAHFEPANAGQQVLHGEALHQFNEIAGLRRKRLDAIGSGLPSVMWSVVLIGAALTISVTYLIQMPRSVHLVATAFLAAFIGLIIFLNVSLDKPLNGPLAIY